MMNTMSNSFAAKENTNGITVTMLCDVDRNPSATSKNPNNKYFQYFVDLGYSNYEAELIADLFRSSANRKDIFIRQPIKKTDTLILRCLDSVELYIQPSGVKDAQLVCRLSLETALKLADSGIATWEHTSRHFLEHYLLA